MALQCSKKVHTKWIPTRKMKIVFVLMCVLVMGTVLLLKIFLPRPLAVTDIYHLVRVLIDKQRFHVDDKIVDEDDVPIQIHVDKKLVYDHLLKVRTMQPGVASNGPVFGYYSQLMSLQEQVDMMVTVETFAIACERANLTYFLWGGSLIGAYRHHGFIPWDDDFDVVMNGADWRKIRNVLSRVQGYQLLVSRGSQWKFFRNDLPVISDRPFKWPFLDIFFFIEDATHVWSLTDSLKVELVNHREDIFPLQFRPFGHLLLAVPCKTEDIVNNLYKVNECRSPDFSHRNTEALDPSTLMSIPCYRLHTLYPFVFREKSTNSENVTEILKIGDTILSNVSVPVCKS